jgi:hypothetical protein
LNEISYAAAAMENHPRAYCSLKQNKRFQPRSRHGDGIETRKRKLQLEKLTRLAEEAKTRKIDLVEGNEPGK